jgi:hypothetical protein
MGGKEWLRRLRSMNEGQTTAGSRGGVQKDRRVSGWERRGEEWWRRRRWKHHTMNAGTAGLPALHEPVLPSIVSRLIVALRLDPGAADHHWLRNLTLPRRIGANVILLV